MTLTPASPRFRTSSEGYDREEVDAFVRAVEDTQTRLQQQVAHLEGAVVNYQQCKAATEELHTRLADRQRELDQSVKSWLTSVIPALREYQEILRGVGVERPSSATMILPTAVDSHVDSDPAAVVAPAPTSRQPRRFLQHSNRLT